MKRLTLIFALVMTLNVQGQEWEIAKQENGITVSTKPMEGSSFDAFKAEMDVKGKPEQVEHILRNMDKYIDMFPSTSSIEVLQKSGNKVMVYTVSEAPWPVDDRDGIYETEFSRTPNGGFKSIATSLPDHLPEKEDMVRIQRSWTSWEVTPKSGGLMNVVYTVEAEPGGSIPAWLASSAAVDIPYDTFVNLKSILKELNP